MPCRNELGEALVSDGAPGGHKFRLGESARAAAKVITTILICLLVGLFFCAYHVQTTRLAALPREQSTSSIDALELDACPYSGYKTCWMWGDASLIGHWAAEIDPFRWSSWLSMQGAIHDLRGYATKERPVQMLSEACGRRWQHTYPNVSLAIRSLQVEVQARDSKNLPLRFDPDISASLAYVSGVTYESHECHEAISKWTCTRCKQSGLIMQDSVQQFGAASLVLQRPHAFYGLVAKPEGSSPLAGSCLIAFRGSNSLVNKVDDLFEVLKEVPSEWHCPSCYVHTGWLDIWNTLEQPAIDALRSKGCSTIALTGHSLGGALATLGAWVLKHKYSFDLSMVYTYESPRVGNPVFARAWDSSIAMRIPAFRITYAKDPWVNYPCQWGGYRHVLYEVHYEGGGSYTVNLYQEAPCGEAEYLEEILNDPEADHCDVPYVVGGICSSSISGYC
eukprot:TRINITY_DN66067_c0_g1_i1.p1 TRINITY_DN66067_c0_g1~~TRINITY_DN66067_c0_g1_i1.p1  ORF type:complete len:473 (-),score=-9.49 TRINITY_DN66067_c0_g1_i1:14-1360(-)